MTPDTSAVSSKTAPAGISPSAALMPTGFDGLPGPLIMAITTAIYLAIASLSLRFVVTPERISPIWPANAVVIALMVRLNRRRWYWVLFGEALGCFAANLIASIPVASMCCYTAGNVVETLVVVLILTRCGNDKVDFSSLRHFIRLLIAAGPGNALTAAIVAAANFYLAKGPDFSSFWQLWAPADGLGMLVVVPTLLSYRRARRGHGIASSTVEGLCLLGALMVVAFVLFSRKWPAGIFIVNRPFLVTVPLLLWAALRTNVFLVCLTALTLSSFAVGGTLLGRGPFVAAEPTIERAIVTLQLTLMAWTACGLIISIVIAENRRTLDVVSRERERFRQLTENIGEVFWMADAGIEQTFYISPAYEKVWGRTCESLIANPKSFIEAIHPDDRQRVAKYLPIQNTGVPFAHEYRVVRPDGSIRWVFDRGFPVVDAKGQVTHYAGVALDITEEKEFQRALLEANKFNNQIISSVQDGVIVLDRELRYCVWNPAMEQISGMPAASVLGKTPMELFAFLRDAGVIPMLERALAGETVSSPDFPYEIPQSGRKGWSWQLMGPLRSADGPIIGVITVVRDITERKRSEELLRQSHERFQVLAAATFEGILISENGRTIDCNEQLARMFGYDRDELNGKPIETIIPLEDRERILTNVAMGRDGNAQHGGLRKDGSRIIVEGRGRTVSYSGRQVRITALRDVTDRVRMQELAIQSEKMLSIGGLAAGMAHEINNPLAIMMQNAEVVSHRVDSELPQNQAAAERAGTTIDAIRAYLKDREILEMLDGIHKSGERAATIIRNMLAFSRPSSSSMGMHFLDELVNSAIELARSDYELKKRYDVGRVEVAREFDADLPPVICHGSEVEQVLFNLFKNAVEASAANSPAAVSPRIVVRTRREKDQARIEVEDNGPGMPESVRRRVFEPFFTTKSPGEGTGLGLFISYCIICQRHNGTMCVNPGPSGGTRFEIMLPLEGLSADERTLLPN